MCSNNISNKEQQRNKQPDHLSNHFLLILCCLYLIQGLPIGLAFHSIPVLLRYSGFSLEHVAIIQLSCLFWALKFLWGSVVENYSFSCLGKRKSWIIPMQLIISFAFLSLSFVVIEQQSLVILVSLLALMSFAGATQDIVTDAFAAEHCPSSYLGIVNTIQISGVIIGLLIAGPLALISFDYYGYQNTFIALSSLVLLALLPIIFYKEKTIHYSSKKKASLKGFMATPYTLSSIVLCSFVTVYGVILLAITKFILIDLGWSNSDIGIITGGGHMMMMLLGCFMATAVIKYRGYRFTLITGLCLVLIGGCCWWGVEKYPLINNFFIWLSALIVGLGMGLVAVSTYTYTMRFSLQSEQPATNISVFQSAQTLCEIVFSSIATVMVGMFGYNIIFIIGSLLALTCIVALLKLSYYKHFNFH